MDTNKIVNVINESCKYKLGDELLYNAAYPAYHVKIVSRMIIENDTEDKDYNVSTQYEVEYGCIRLGRIDYVIACEHELEEIE